MWTLQDAKNRFSTVVEAALSGRPQQVTRRGRPAVVVIADEEYRRLVAQATENRESFADHLMRFPGGPEDKVERLQVHPRDVNF